MVVGAILAGGLSRRMGEDKATLYGGVTRLQRCFEAAGINTTVVMCGTAARKSLFEGEVWTDPPGANGLHEVIPWLLNRVNDDLVLMPCDAYLMSERALSHYLQRAKRGGVPMDKSGRRQPLFAFIPKGADLPSTSDSVSHLIDNLPSVDVAPHGEAFTNFNRPSDLQHPQLQRRRR